MKALGDAWIVRFVLERRQLAEGEQSQERSPHRPQHGDFEINDQRRRDRHQRLAALDDRIQQEQADGQKSSRDDARDRPHGGGAAHSPMVMRPAEHFGFIRRARHDGDLIVHHAQLVQAVDGIGGGFYIVE